MATAMIRLGSRLAGHGGSTTLRVAGITALIGLSLLPYMSTPDHAPAVRLQVEACAEAIFTPPPPLIISMGEGFPFVVTFGRTFEAISSVSATSTFDPRDPLDPGERYFIFNFGGQENRGTTSWTTTTLRGVPPGLEAFDDGVFEGNYTSFAGNFILKSLTWCVSEIGPAAIAASIDVKPGSCPNPLNVRSRGVLPVAIVGTASFDVKAVDPTSIRLEGIRPLRFVFEDSATPFAGAFDPKKPLSCTAKGPDGIADLSLKFDVESLALAFSEVENREVRTLILIGQLKPEFGSTPFRGMDVVVILAP